MKIVLKVILALFIVGIIFGSVWFSLDKRTKCKLIYGKNICNFYEMMEVVSTNPEKSDFEKAMRLCRGMEDVPKKDSCFEYIAEVVSFYDKEKAREACEEIKEFDNVQSKEDCLNRIQKSIEEKLAESSVTAFMTERITRNEERALNWLTDNAKGQYLLRSDKPLIGLSNPHFADFEILETEKLDSEKFKFEVRIYEEYTGEGIIGYFDEDLVVIKKDNQYLIDSMERGEYINTRK